METAVKVATTIATTSLGIHSVMEISSHALEDNGLQLGISEVPPNSQTQRISKPENTGRNNYDKVDIPVVPLAILSLTDPVL